MELTWSSLLTRCWGWKGRQNVSWWRKKPCKEEIMEILKIINHYITFQSVIKGCKHNKMNHKVHNKCLNYNFISLKNHKRNIINWIFNFFYFWSSITYKVSLFKTWCKLMMFQESFCMFKAIDTMVFFSNIFFSYQMCTILFQNKKGSSHWW